MYKATITITLRTSILDPQGKAAHQALQNLGMDSINRVRIGKSIELDIEAANEKMAQSVADEAARKLLANEVMEDYQIEIESV
ncbi:MAG: phosphoribosylformylglycinamidine synthase subunit PurS [Balneolaceae bacterium]